MFISLVAGTRTDSGKFQIAEEKSIGLVLEREVA